MLFYDYQYADHVSLTENQVRYNVGLVHIFLALLNPTYRNLN